MKATIINTWYFRGSQMLTAAWEKNGTKKNTPHINTHTRTHTHTHTDKSTKLQFQTHGPFDRAITTRGQRSRGWRFAIHTGQFIPCLWMPHRVNNDQSPYIISCLLSSPLLHMHVFNSTLPSTGPAKNRAARWPEICQAFIPEFTCHLALLL